MISLPASTTLFLPQSPLRDEIAPRVKWLIHLRYVAVAGVGVILLVAGRLPVTIDIASHVMLLAALLITNLFYHVVARGYRNKNHDISRWVGLAHWQITTDFILLTLLLHFAGGLENPFCVFYVFHTAFAGLMLYPKLAMFEAALGLGMYAAMVIGEGTGVLRHYPLNLWLEPDANKDPIAITAAIVSIGTSMFFMAYLMSSLARTIGEKEDRRTELQKDLKRRGDELAEANRRLEHGMKEREEFLRTVEHELKSPLSAIRSNLEAILAAGGDLPELVRDMIKRSSERSHELLDMVRDLLAMSRVEREVDAGVDEDIDLSTVVHDEAVLIQPLAEEKGLTLEMDVPMGVHIHGSPIAARYCVSNLLSNAVRYTDEGMVRVVLLQERDDIFLQVSDTGIGIAKADQERIFQEFYRTQSARRSVAEGTGVGLAVVKRALEALQGDIEVDSEVGSGATFTLRFPGAQ